MSERFQEVVCREFVGLVTDYLDGALPADRAALLEQHVVLCDSCKTYLEQIETTVTALPAVAESEVAVPAETEQALLAAFRTWRSR